MNLIDEYLKIIKEFYELNEKYYKNNYYYDNNKKEYNRFIIDDYDDYGQDEYIIDYQDIIPDFIISFDKTLLHIKRELEFIKT